MTPEHAEAMPDLCSISYRLQRVTVEDVYVLVPVDERVLADDDASQARHVDPAKLVERAIAVAAGWSDWQQESQQVGSHPVQQKRPDARTARIQPEPGAE